MRSLTASAAFEQFGVGHHNRADCVNYIVWLSTRKNTKKSFFYQTFKWITEKHNYLVFEELYEFKYCFYLWAFESWGYKVRKIVNVNEIDLCIVEGIPQNLFP